MSKRGSSIYEEDELEGGFEASAAKRAKIDTSADNSMALISSIKSHHTSLILSSTSNNQRVSSLSSPEMSLSGHDGAIYSMAFDPEGKHICSASMDRQLFLWDITGEGKNYNVMRGHKSAVLQVCWPSENSIISCSADKTVAVWDANRGVRSRKLTEHTGIVNSCHAARNVPTLFASGSDDCTAILWDARSKESIMTAYHDYQVCAVTMSPDGNFLFTAGVDSVIRRFDTRVGNFDSPDLMMEGHTDIITGLSVSSDGNRLLSNSMDCSLRIWNVRPFVSESMQQRCEHVLSGVHHGAEKLLLKCSWSYDDEYVSAGSADR
jgi:Prp8 binding protein